MNGLACANGLATRRGLKGNELETLIIFAIAGCLLSAGVTYLLLDYRRHGERELELKKIFQVQQEVAKARKVAAGYTHYLEHLPAAKLAVTEQMRTLMTKVVREHLHIEIIAKDKLKQKPEAVFAIKYVTEYLFCFDLKPDSFDLVSTTGGLEIRVGRPVLYGAPYIRSSTPERLSSEVLEGEKEILRTITGKLATLAQQHGASIASEEAIRALCDKRLLEFVSSFLAGQKGVTQVPGMSVLYK
jgi:hypothetical protein